MRELNAVELNFVSAGLQAAPGTGNSRRPHQDQTRDDHGRGGGGGGGGFVDRVSNAAREVAKEAAGVLNRLIDTVGRAVNGDSGRQENYRDNVSCPPEKDMVGSDCVTPGRGR